MTRLRLLAGAIVLVGLAIAAAVWLRTAAPTPAPVIAQRRIPLHEGGGDPAALKRLRTVPLYRALVATNTLRAGPIERDGTIHVEVDLRALAEPRLAAVGLAGVSSMLPALAVGTIAMTEGQDGRPGVVTRESWLMQGPAPLLDVLDRAAPAEDGTRVWDAVPGAPSAVARLRLLPSRLADPALLDGALTSWRDRVEVVERLLGRDVRAEIAEDLAGPAVFALYDGDGSRDADALAGFELRRADRLAGLLDTVFGLGALTDRAVVRRYRGVATGSFARAGGGPGVALAVDGNVLFIASSRSRLESAIDSRRAPGRFDGLPFPEGPRHGSWRAVSMSTFAARGWARLARVEDAKVPGVETVIATLTPEGTADWRLDGAGPSPAITADPIVPFLRSVFASRQREGG